MDNLTKPLIALLIAALLGCSRTPEPVANERSLRRTVEPSAPAATGGIATRLPADVGNRGASKLSQRLSGLISAAERGEPTAACIVAASYDYCAFVDEQLRGAQAVMENASEQQAGDNSDAKGYATQALARSDRCEGVRVPDPAARARLWRTAAIGGNLYAATQYSTGRVFALSEMLDTLDVLRIYKSEAEQMARAAAAQGSIEAIWALADAYDPSQIHQGSLLAQATKQDQRKALVYQIALTQIGGNAVPAAYAPALQTRIRRAQARLTKAEYENAARQAREIASKAQQLGPQEAASRSHPTLEGQSRVCTNYSESI